MSSHNMPELSIVAKYDDLCRHTRVLTTGCEKEFKRFVESQKQMLIKRKEAENQLKILQQKVSSLENEKQKYEAQLKHMKNAVMKEIEKRKKVEQVKASMERQIALIKEVLLSNNNAIDNETKEKFFLLSSTYKHQGGSPSRLTTIEESIGSLLSPSECDESSEDIGITHRKRRSSRPKVSDENSFKKKKSEERKDRFSFEEAFRLDGINIIPRTNQIDCHSSSDPNSNSPESETPTHRPIFRSESEQIKDLRRRSSTVSYNGSTPVGRFSIGGVGNRTHAFASKTVIRNEKCYPCGKVIKFCKQVLKCNKCRITCHPECKDKCPEQCIPASATPTRGLVGSIGDYTPSTSPMIPPLIVHCVNKIESIGMKEIGLYRVPGADREVKCLKEKFLRGKSIPSLNDIDIHVICGTVKDFLRSLKDTLVTQAAWQTFTDAASLSDDHQSLNSVFSAVCDLPQPNKDTLAFLILHLQRIAASPECKMPLENLAKVFGPTIVGYSSPDSSHSKMLTETRLQCKVMEKLLKIPSDSWQTLLNMQNDPFYTPMRTPESTPAPVTSRLGPILTSGHSSRTTTPISKTPLKPRSRTGSKVGRRQFFQSPLIK